MYCSEITGWSFIRQYCFLGFASTIVPLGFAYSSLSTKNFGDWVKPALPWALFSGCVLGVGIMMGGKWAYESLSFGGYWAWDPVENAALLPWMILLQGCIAWQFIMQPAMH